MTNFSAIVVVVVLAVVSCNGFVQAKAVGSHGLMQNVNKVRGSETKMVATDFTPELKPPPSMYANAVNAGAAKASLSPLKIFVGGILSGCHIAFGALLMLSVGGACPGLVATNPGLQKIISGAFGLPFGLAMTLIGGGELFTGNTALVTAAVVEKKATLKDLIKSWFFSYAGNFVGSVALAALVFNAGLLADGGILGAAVKAANLKVSGSFKSLFLKGILCNWLVCMAVYMASGASSLAGKMVAIFFPISAFVAIGLEHSVANMFLIPLGIMRGADITNTAFLMKNLLPVTLGNIVGGAGCVALGYSAFYGSLLDKFSPKKDSPAAALVASVPAPTKLTSIRGGFTPGPTVRSTDTKLNMKIEAVITPEARERALVGNPIEKVKQKKDPTQLWTDVHEFAAAIRAGTTSWEEIGTEDMDIRIKYAGMFHRKKATPGRLMMRLRLPNGIINSSDMRYFAQVVRPYGPEIGVVDITCRANIQLRSPPLEDASTILKELQARGHTTLMSGLDNLRNMVGSPIAGIDTDEIYDTRRLTKEIDQWYTNKGQGNPEWANMPRKFNIAVSGTRDDFAHTNINDIGLQACPHETTGEMGFNVALGGYISIKRAAEAIPMNAWIPEKDALELCKAILRKFRDEGARGDRQKTRLMWLIESKTIEVFAAEVAAEMAVNMGLASYTYQPVQKFKSEWTKGKRDVNGVHAQPQAGLSYVGVHVPVGRLSADECDEIAVIADKYSGGEVRLTVEQNVLFPNIPNERLAEFLAEPMLTKAGSRMTVTPGNIVGHVVSCTGAQFCPLAMVETKLAIDDITKKLELMVIAPKPIRIHMTGCPNSCGQVQVADIGLMGAPAKKADAEGKMKAVPGVNIFIGGKVGEAASMQLEPAMKGIPMLEEDLLPVLAKIIVDQYNGVMISPQPVFEKMVYRAP